MTGRDRQDVETAVGRGQPGADTGPTAGHAGAQSTDAALGLGGTREAAGTTGAPRGDELERREREDVEGGFGTGLETGHAARGSSANAAARVDTFNTPGERPGTDRASPR